MVMNFIILELIMGLILAIIGILGSFEVLKIGLWSWIVLGIGFIFLLIALFQQKKSQK